MKKARALSTICISLAAGPLFAQVPGPGQCFARGYDAAHLAAHPSQGVEALRLWFYDADLDDPASRMVIVEARMAGQGQAVAFGVEGMVLTSTLFCEAGGCFVECDGGGFTALALPDGGLEIATEGMSIGTPETCGGTADLAEGGPTRYRLAAVPATACADLSYAHPLPEPGCYGVAYPRVDASGLIAAVTLRLEAPHLAGARPAFPWLEGVIALDVAPEPTPEPTPGPTGAGRGAGELAGARVMLPVWCGADSGRCVSESGDAVLDFAAQGPELVLTATRFTVYGRREAAIDLTAGRAPRHALVRLAPEACAELELE